MDDRPASTSEPEEAQDAEGVTVDAGGPGPSDPPAQPEAEADGDVSGDDELAAAGDLVSGEIDELTRTAAERDDYLDALRRLQADFENFKKRMAKQQSDTLERAAESLVEKLLPVLDTIDLARSHGNSAAVDQVGTALVDILAKEGLERVVGAGEPFDPTIHDAVLHEDGDGAPEIVEVMRAGYTWRGRLVRAAMVKVKGS